MQLFLLCSRLNYQYFRVTELCTCVCYTYVLFTTHTDVKFTIEHNSSKLLVPYHISNNMHHSAAILYKQILCNILVLKLKNIHILVILLLWHSQIYPEILPVEKFRNNLKKMTPHRFICPKYLRNLRAFFRGVRVFWCRTSFINDYLEWYQPCYFLN